MSAWGHYKTAQRQRASAAGSYFGLWIGSAIPALWGRTRLEAAHD